MTKPVFVLLDNCPPTGNTHQLDEGKVALNHPSQPGVLFHVNALDMINRDFSALEYIRSIAPRGILKRIMLIGIPVPAVPTFPTITLNIGVRNQPPVPLVLPATWLLPRDFFDDFYLPALDVLVTELQEQEEYGDLHGLGYCPTARSPSDGEAEYPSHQRPDTSYASQLEANGYTDAGQIAAMAYGCGETQRRLPGLPISFPMLTPQIQGCGGAYDPKCTFANAQFAAMLAASQNSLLTPQNLCIRAGSSGGWAVDTGRQMAGGRLALQLSTDPRDTPSIQGAVGRANSIGYDWLEVHPYQLADTADYLAAPAQPQAAVPLAA